MYMNQNKVVLITGASSGLGLATAVLAAKEGYSVVATMRDLSKGNALAESAAQAGVTVETDVLDVCDEASVTACVGRTLERHGRIDVLINNAGFGIAMCAELVPEQRAREIFDVNILGVMRCVQAVLPSMRARRSGHIISISSIAGLVGMPTLEVYIATKFAVEGFMEGIATYLKPYFNIDCSLVEPGDIHTHFTQRVLDDLMALAGSGGKASLDSITPDVVKKILGDRFTDYGPIMWDHKKAFLSPEGLFANAQSAEEVAEVILMVMKDPHPKMRYQSSKYARRFCAEKLAADADGTRQRARVAARELGKVYV
jgi:short-subunit dehydrogenase